MTTGIAVTGLGLAAPERTVTNADLEQFLDTSDEWIRSRSGIAERRWVAPHETTASLAAEAVASALKAAGRTPDEVGYLLVATCTPDHSLPNTAAAVCDALGITAGCLDLNAACTGFVSALIAAVGMVAASPGPVVVVGSERMSAMVDHGDRNTAVLFGDGAGAIVLEPGDGALLGWDAGTDGSLRPLLHTPPGGYLQMDGAEVFRRAVRVVVDSAATACERAGISPTDIDAFVPHQANIRIVDAAATRLGIAEDHIVVNLDRWGNTSAASIAIALAEADAAGRLHPGDHVLLSGFGAGMTWASAVLRWAR